MAQLSKEEIEAKLKSLKKNYRALKKVELDALRFYREPDYNNMEVSLLFCQNKRFLPIWNYYRNAVSSAGQGGGLVGRSNPFMVIDKNSGAVLGLFSVGDAPMKVPYFSKYIGVDGWTDGNEKNNHLKWERYHTVLYLHRCLPLYPFSQFLFGKLIALLASSSNLVKVLEQKYSFKYTVLLIRTLHGKSSLYNRLHSRGIEFIGVDEFNRGHYVMELRKHGLQYLRGERDLNNVSFKSKMYSLSENFEYWYKRWFLGRYERLKDEIVFDKKYYTLNAIIQRYEKELMDA